MDRFQENLTHPNKSFWSHRTIRDGFYKKVGKFGDFNTWNTH